MHARALAGAQVDDCRVFHNGGAGLAVGPDCAGSAARNDVFGNAAGIMATPDLWD